MSVLSKLQAAKTHRLPSHRWISLRWYQAIAHWKATKAQYWTWPANLQALPLPRESAEQQDEQSTARDEWVSIVQPVANEIVGFMQQIPKQLLVGIMD